MRGKLERMSFEKAPSENWSTVYERMMPDTKCKLGKKFHVIPMDTFYRICTECTTSSFNKYIEKIGESAQ